MDERDWLARRFDEERPQRDAQMLLELIEPMCPEKHLAQDEQTPRVARA